MFHLISSRYSICLLRAVSVVQRRNCSELVTLSSLSMQHKPLVYALLQSNTIHFNFAFFPKYEALSLPILGFGASICAIFVSHDLLPLFFRIIFWIGLPSHNVTLWGLQKKKCSFSHCLSEMFSSSSQINSELSKSQSCEYFAPDSCRDLVSY